MICYADHGRLRDVVYTNDFPTAAHTISCVSTSWFCRDRGPETAMSFARVTLSMDVGGRKLRHLQVLGCFQFLKWCFFTHLCYLIYVLWPFWKEFASKMSVEPSFSINDMLLIRRSSLMKSDAAKQFCKLRRVMKLIIIFCYGWYLIAINSLESRFQELQAFRNIFGFLMSSTTLKSLDDSKL